MASAIEISRTGKGPERTVSVLVHPPIFDGVKEVDQSIGRAIFDDPNFENAAGDRRGVELEQKVLLGEEAQIVELWVHDGRKGHDADQTTGVAVDALHTYVYAMAEGEIQNLRQFFPGNA